MGTSEGEWLNLIPAVGAKTRGMQVWLCHPVRGSRFERDLAPPEGVQLVDTPHGVCALLSWIVRVSAVKT